MANGGEVPREWIERQKKLEITWKKVKGALDTVYTKMHDISTHVHRSDELLQRSNGSPGAVVCVINTLNKAVKNTNPYLKKILRK